MNKIKVTMCRCYEYFSKDDAALHHNEDIEDGFILKKSYETIGGTWIFEYEKTIC